MAHLSIPRAYDASDITRTLNVVGDMYGEALEMGADLSPKDLQECEMKLAEVMALIKKAKYTLSDVHEKIYALRYERE